MSNRYWVVKLSGRVLYNLGDSLAPSEFRALREEPQTGEEFQTGSWTWQEASGDRSERQGYGSLSIQLKMCRFAFST